MHIEAEMMWSRLDWSAVKPRTDCRTNTNCQSASSFSVYMGYIINLWRSRIQFIFSLMRCRLDWSAVKPRTDYRLNPDLTLLDRVRHAYLALSTVVVMHTVHTEAEAMWCRLDWSAVKPRTDCRLDANLTLPRKTQQRRTSSVSLQKPPPPRKPHAVGGGRSGGRIPVTPLRQGRPAALTPGAEQHAV